MRELIAEKLQLSEDELNEQMHSGASRFDNHIAWAKFYLAKAGYIDASKRGVWSLTEKGINANINDKDAVTTHPSFPRKRESMLLVLITGLSENNEQPVST